MFFDFDPVPFLTPSALIALPDWAFSQAFIPSPDVKETITIKGAPSSSSTRNLGGVVDQRE